LNGKKCPRSVIIVSILILMEYLSEDVERFVEKEWERRSFNPYFNGIPFGSPISND